MKLLNWLITSIQFRGIRENPSCWSRHNQGSRASRCSGRSLFDSDLESPTSLHAESDNFRQCNTLHELTGGVLADSLTLMSKSDWPTVWMCKEE